MASYQCVPRLRDYKHERNTMTLKRHATSMHPLQKDTSMNSNVGSLTTPIKLDAAISPPPPPVATSISTDVPSDPLSNNDPLSSVSAVDEFIDPLSAMSSSADFASTFVGQRNSGNSMKNSNSNLDNVSSSINVDKPHFEPWSSRRQNILQNYTTSEKLSISSSYLKADDGSNKVVMTVKTEVKDKLPYRLDQLDDGSESNVQEMMDLSQQEYMSRIEELNQGLIEAWDTDQRVKSLKISIQCAKLLSDTSVIKFYPSKFVLVTDILNTFSRLVYDRIRLKSVFFEKGKSTPTKLPEHFTPEQVPESAKETCRNWFFKIASIRELVPRFYAEASILKCYSFLAVDEYAATISRLSAMIRGIGDPLVAVYARCYLCYVCMDVAPQHRSLLRSNFTDFVFTYRQLKEASLKTLLAIHNVDDSSYLLLYTPAVDWILQCVMIDASEEVHEQILKQYQADCNNGLVLNFIMKAYPRDFISVRAVFFTALIKDAELCGFPKHVLYRTLGVSLCSRGPPESERRAILNEVWKFITKLTNVEQYISCAEVWIEYPVLYFTSKEVNTLLGDVIAHVLPDRAFELYYPQLQSIINKVLMHMHDFSEIFAMDNILPFIDLFQKRDIKVEICHMILNAFVCFQTQTTNDPIVVNSLIYIAKVVHDSVNALTFQDHVRQFSEVIANFLLKISFGRDLEKQLNFYVECRANFTNLDAVMVCLVQCTCTLVMQTERYIKSGRSHTHKTIAFVRACIAYCFITIPSIYDVFSRLSLYLLAGRVALVQKALPQADSFFKSAVTMICEIPETIEVDGVEGGSTESRLVDFLRSFISTLVVLPDHPDHGMLYIVKGLLNAIQEYKWNDNNDAKMFIYLDIFTLCNTLSQTRYPYTITGIECNDTLYGSDPAFLAEITKISNTILDELLNVLSALGQKKEHKRQAKLAISLFSNLCGLVQLVNGKSATLAINLWNLARKHDGAVDDERIRRECDAVKAKACDEKIEVELRQRFTDMLVLMTK